jgi:hypothetical protein
VGLSPGNLYQYPAYPVDEILSKYIY